MFDVTQDLQSILEAFFEELRREEEEATRQREEYERERSEWLRNQPPRPAGVTPPPSGGGSAVAPTTERSQGGHSKK